MSITIQQLRDELENIAQSSDLESLKTAAEEAEKRFKALNTSDKGLSISTSNGFRTVTVSRDHPDSDGTAPGDAICFLTAEIDGIPLTEEVPSVDKSAIDAIVGTGSAVQNGFLKEFAGASSPRALKASLQEASGKDPAELTDALTKILPEDLRAEAKAAIRAGLDTAEKLGEKLDETVAEVKKKIEAQQGDLTPMTMENITLKLDGEAINELKSLTNNAFNDADIKGALTALSSLDANNIAGVISDVAKRSGLPLDDIENRVRSIDTSVAGNLARSSFTDALGTATSVVNQVNAQTQLWEGEKTEIQAERLGGGT